MKYKTSNLTRRSFFLMACMLLSFQPYAQSVRYLPDESVRVDKKQVLEIEKMMRQIDDMPLLIDTIFGPAQTPVLYFDDEGRLRKYVSEYGWEIERGRTVAYWDDNGKLVYFEYEGGSNCEGEEEHYYVRDERIVDFSYYYECYCCEEEVEISSMRRPAIGGLFVDAVSGWGKSFTDAHSILDAEVIGSECQWAEYLVLPASFPIDKPEQDRVSGYDYERLKSLPQAVLLDSEIYLPTTTGLLAVKGDDSAVAFSSVLASCGFGDDCTIERKNVDGAGNDELIVRRRYRNEDARPDSRYVDEKRSIEVWDLDARTCLLNIQDMHAHAYCRYDSTGKIVEESGVHHELKVNLAEKRLSIQKVKNGMSGLTYTYHLTESGFVLDKVTR